MRRKRILISFPAEQVSSAVGATVRKSAVRRGGGCEDVTATAHGAAEGKEEGGRRMEEEEEVTDFSKR